MKENITLFLILISLSSCLKYLDKVPNPALSIPHTVQDFRALMDNDMMTENSTPGLGQLGSDDYMLTDSIWQHTETIPKNAYIWGKDIYENEKVPSWSTSYEVIYQCNVVLSQLPGVPRPDSAVRAEYDAVMGAALFTRAFQFYALEETFGQPYRANTAGSVPGIPLRLIPDLHQQVGRSTVRQVYTQIIADAKSAIPLLPDEVQWSNRNRPCKPAAYALLSRCYLSMQEYDSAGQYADSSLHYYDKLVDYNTVDTAIARPFPILGNDEVLFQCSAVSIATQYFNTTELDTFLYRSYAANDLRRAVFFRLTPDSTAHYFRGHYSGKVFLFSGMATDEVYLTRAECYARTGQQAAALQDLNTLLSRRWKTGTFQPYTVATAGDVPALILAERRKETLFRETRWADLRRLNPEANLALRRILHGSVYTLSGNLRLAYPIPKDEVNLGGVQQNPR